MSDLISKLSEIRSKYNCFNGDEEPYYRALSETIRLLSQRVDGDTISRQAAIDALMKEWEAYKDYPYPSHIKDGLAQAIIILDKKVPSERIEITEKDVKEYCTKRCLVVMDNQCFQKLKCNSPNFYCGYYEDICKEQNGGIK